MAKKGTPPKTAAAKSADSTKAAPKKAAKTKTAAEKAAATRKANKEAKQAEITAKFKVSITAEAKQLKGAQDKRDAKFKGVADHTITSHPSENPGLYTYLFWKIHVLEAAYIGVFPLRILADYNHVNIECLLICQGRGDTRVEYVWALTDILIKPSSNR